MNTLEQCPLKSEEADFLLSLNDSDLTQWLLKLPRDQQAAILCQLKQHRTPTERATVDTHEFTKQAWPTLRPGEKFIDGWHIRAMCEHLDAMERGEIMKMRWAVPPGTMKSILCNVIFVARVLANDPSASFLCASYSQELSNRDSVECRNLIQSEWYQSRWPHVKIAGDQNQKIRFDTTAGGWRMATSVEGRGTGDHPRFRIGDDLLSAAEAESEAECERASNWIDRTFSTRGAIKNSRLLIVGQRLSIHDCHAHIESKNDPDWDSIILPMRYAPGLMKPTSIGWTDPRTKPGELLWPAAFSEKKVQDLEIGLGGPNSSGAVAQLGQHPRRSTDRSEWPEEYFASEWLWYDELPDGAAWVRTLALDPSKGKDSKRGDYSAIVMIAVDPKSDVAYIDADLQRRPTNQIKADFVEACRVFKPDAAGVEVNQFQELLGGIILDEAGKQCVHIPLWTLDNRINKLVRIRRLGPYLAQKKLRFKQSSAGAQMLVEQLKDFPNGVHDDGPDGLEMAIRLLQLITGGTVNGDPGSDMTGGAYGGNVELARA